jgi:hypothetical protein
VTAPAALSGRWHQRSSILKLYDSILRLVDLLEKPNDLQHPGALIQREIIYRSHETGVRAFQARRILLGENLDAATAAARS